MNQDPAMIIPEQAAHKVMTPEEYAFMEIRGWHSVCRDYDGFGAVGLRFHTDGAAQPLVGVQRPEDVRAVIIRKLAEWDTDFEAERCADAIMGALAETAALRPHTGQPQEGWSEEERHAVGHARYQVERATPDNPEVAFDYTLVATLLRLIDRLSPVPQAGCAISAVAAKQRFPQPEGDTPPQQAD